MRVTKTIRDYVEKKVAESVTRKYEADRLEAERQKALIDEFWDVLMDELENFAKERVFAFINEHPFTQRGTINKIISHYSSAIDISDYRSPNSVHNWSRRAQVEISDKVNEIVATLELGGNKADLDRMLSEL